jgi:hypothetical protein
MIEYNTTDDPTETGVYACRVELYRHRESSGLFEDVFLMWLWGRWNRLGSDQPWRHPVAGWAGPLRRKLK